MPLFGSLPGYKYHLGNRTGLNRVGILCTSLDTLQSIDVVVPVTVCVFILSVAGQDFNAPSPPEVTFFSGDAQGDTACAPYGIIDDDNLEFDHDFTVNLSTVTPTGPVLPVPSSTTVVTITDDEGMHIIHYCCKCVLSPSEKGGT